jgi:hypothetical protein
VITGTFPIVSGPVTLSRQGTSYVCSIATPSAPNLAAFPGGVGAAYAGNPGVAKALSAFVQTTTAAPPSSAGVLPGVPMTVAVNPPTAVAPDLPTAVCAAVVCWSLVVLGRPLAGGSSSQDDDLGNALSAALLGASLTSGGGLAGARFPMRISGVINPAA